MKAYYCYLTVMLPSYQDAIVAGMVTKGYMVGPASKDGKVSPEPRDGSPSALLALQVYKVPDVDVNKVYDDLLDVLKDMKAHYYSVVIVTAVTEAVWVGSNVVLPKKEKAVPPPIPGPKKDMN